MHASRALTRFLAPLQSAPMKRLFVLLLPLLVLAGCASKPPQLTLEEALLNPLFAEQYYDMLVDLIVELEIKKDPLLEDKRKKATADEARRDALAKAKEATKVQREGTMGGFVPAKEFAKGEVLYRENRLFLGSTFETSPGPSLHLFLSTVVDPRDTAFPDDTSIDLGRLESAFGAQQYSVPPMDNPLLYRTVVLFDTKFERIYGFAQLSK